MGQPNKEEAKMPVQRPGEPKVADGHGRTRPNALRISHRRLRNCELGPSPKSRGRSEDRSAFGSKSRIPRCTELQKRELTESANRSIARRAGKSRPPHSGRHVGLT